jgi:hypothetical protein
MKSMILLAVAAIGVLQWLFVAVLATTTKETFPKTGLRRAEKNLVASSILLALTWIAQIDPAFLWSGTGPSASAASLNPAGSSCARVSPGMSVNELKKKMGEPTRSTPDEETRGPGAVTLYYDASRCAVHVFDGKVEFVD